MGKKPLTRRGSHRNFFDGPFLFFYSFIYYFNSGLYYGVTICLVTFASGLSVVTLNLHHRGVRGVRVHPTLRKIILGYISKLVLLNFDDEEKYKQKTVKTCVLINSFLRNIWLWNNYKSLINCRYSECSYLIFYMLMLLN